MENPGNTHIIDKPHQADNEQTPTIEAQNKLVRRLGVLHRVALKLLWLVEEESQNQEYHRENDADSETGSPDRAEVLVVAGRCHDVGYKCTDDEALWVPHG